MRRVGVALQCDDDDYCLLDVSFNGGSMELGEYNVYILLSA